jgi:tRNA dimethylallyltransferase
LERCSNTLIINVSTWLSKRPSLLDAHSGRPKFPVDYAEPRTSNVLFGLDLPVDIRRQRITVRLHERLNNGMIQEVERLLAGGVPAEKLIFYGLEYKFITQFLAGELDYVTMTARLETAIHQFAKRQMTYFRKMERDGHTIHWLDAQRPTGELADEVIRIFDSQV